MKKICLAAIIAIALSGCQTTSDIDTGLTKKDSTCGQSCSAYFKICDDEMTMTPIFHHNACVERFRYCVQACPDKGVVAATKNPASEANGKSASERLKELDSLRKQGLITDSEFQIKKQQILKAM